MINPINMTAVEWTSQMTLILNVLPMKLDRDEDWKEWARHVIQSSNISQYNPPSPESFDDWREWAMRFNQAVPLQ